MAKKRRHSHYGKHMRRRRARGENPHIRHTHEEHRTISLNEAYEVEHAKRAGAIKVNKRGGVSPVPGRSYVKDGRLYYVVEKRRR